MYDTLAQIALMRGGYESAGDYLRQAGEAYGSYGAQTGLWYEWSIRVLEAKLAARRGATEEALRLANEIAAKAPPAEAIQADLIACEALLAGGRAGEAETRVGSMATPHRRARHAGRVGRVSSAARSSARIGRSPL